MIGSILFLSCLFVCLSVCLSVWFRSLVSDFAKVSTVKMLKYKELCSKFGLL